MSFFLNGSPLSLSRVKLCFCSAIIAELQPGLAGAKWDKKPQSSGVRDTIL